VFCATALKLMRLAGVKHRASGCAAFLRVASRWGRLLDWCAHLTASMANEVFGQTECNLAVGSNSKTVSDPAGSMGKATPALMSHRR